VTSDSGSIGTVQLGGYGAYRPGPYMLAGALTYGHHSIDATRLSMLAAPSTASYGADSFGAALELSSKHPLSAGTIEPMAGLAYDALRSNGFSETGDPFLDLTGHAASVATLKGYVGARAFTTYGIDRMQVTPELQARLLYDFLDDPRGYNASFVADPTMTFFPVAGIQPNRTSERLGGSVNVRLAPLWLAFTSYDAEIRGRDVGHFLSGGVKVSW
jgi:outer membrane autotransporter protein